LQAANECAMAFKTPGTRPEFVLMA